MKAVDKVSLALSNLECFAGLFLSSAKPFVFYEVSSVPHPMRVHPFFQCMHKGMRTASSNRPRNGVCILSSLAEGRETCKGPHTPSLGRLRIGYWLGGEIQEQAARVETCSLGPPCSFIWTLGCHCPELLCKDL